MTARTRQPGDRLVLLVGLALTASVFIPWYVDPETQMTWDQPTGVPWIVWVAPWLGFPILLSAFLKPHWARPLLLLSGAALVASMIGVEIDDRAFRRVTVVGATAWTFGLLFAVGAEIAMHRAPRSRGRAVCATVGWLALLVAYAMPMARSGEFDESILGAILSEGKLGVLVLAVPLLFVIAGFVEALRRTGADRDLAASRRFHSAWLAWVVVPIPTLAIAVIAFVDGGIDGLHMGLVLFGVLVGGALGVVAAIELAGTLGRVLTWRRGLLLAGAVVSVAALFAFSGWLRSRGATAAFATRVADQVERAMRGEARDPRYFGGYSEFDLRGTTVTLESGAARVASGVRLWVSSEGARPEAVWALDVGDGVQFTCELDWMQSSDGVPAGDLGREFEREWRDRPLDDGTHAQLSAIGILGAPRACDPSTNRATNAWMTLGEIALEGDSQASVDRYLIAFDTDGERRWYTGLLGDLHGRMWIGAPELREGE